MSGDGIIEVDGYLIDADRVMYVEPSDDNENDLSVTVDGMDCEKLKEYDLRLADRIGAAAKRECGDAATRCVNISEDAPDEMCEIAQRAKSALCFPPRNCDNAATWLDLYAHFHAPKGMREMPPEWVDAIAAFCQWLVATPKEGGAK